MRTLGPRRAVGIVVAALLLAGCGGAPKPKALPTPSEPGTPTASTTPTTPTPPVLPEAAKATSDAAVEAFARHYVDVINYATASGDDSQLLALADDGCASCRTLATRLRTIYDAGGSIRSQGWSVTAAEVIANQPVTRKYIDLAIVQSPQTLVDERRGQSRSAFQAADRL